MLGADVCHRSALIELESGALGTGFSPCEFARLVDRAELPAELQGWIDTVWGDPCASTTSSTDGEDGPSSEDWDND